MNQAISQSTNKVTASVSGEDNWDFVASALRASNRESKENTLTRERALLKRQSLIDLCKQDYRLHFAAIYGKTDKLPAVVFEKIEKAIDEIINRRLREVTPANVVSYRRSFAFKANDMEFVDRVTLIGENTLALKEQLLACHIAIRANDKRLADLQKKPTPDYDREKAVKAMGLKLLVAQDFIEGEIKHQTELQEQKK